MNAKPVAQRRMHPHDRADVRISASPMSCTSAFPRSCWRVARQGPDGAAPPSPEPGSPLDRAIPSGVQPTAAFANRPDVLCADVPSQGTMSARAVARMYAALLGHIDGI